STVNNLAPGATQSFGARVNIASGVREYFARVDTEDTLHEPVVQRANNEKRLRLTIPQVSGQQAAPPGSSPPLETRLLEYGRAKNAGAQFSDGVDGFKGLCDVGQGDPSRLGDHSPGVWFRANCDTLANGARATPEAFIGFRLKNGWRVKNFEISSGKAGNADWQWRQTPTKGSDDPYMRMHVFTSPFGRVWAQVKVTIEGPAGTDPYQ
ncbi:MAG: hypothetical protein NEA02_06950, partial [Thermoanaerobaculia bacterium]|nr:hypothetical protein [Thermoanaerobaculia bacterium]